jgi:hypothetical protein
MRTAEYFDSAGRSLTAHQARDQNGIIRDGVTVRVRMTMRDSADRFTDGRSFWDAHRSSLLVTDARALGGTEGNKQGFRILDSAVNRQEVNDAYRAYEDDLTNAWKVKPATGSSAPVRNRDDERAISGPGPRDSRMTLDQMRASHQQNMDLIYDQITHQLTNAWRAGK